MTHDRRPLCYVAMPFGKKVGPHGEQIDFEAVYDALASTIEDAGFAPFRADEVMTRGSIQAVAVDAVLQAEAMVADLTMANANVLYELGIRHAVRRSGTVIVCAESSAIPFDLSQLRTVFYRLDEHGVPRGFAPSLVEAFRALRAYRVDSPVYELRPELSVELPRTGDDGWIELRRRRSELRSRIEEVLRRSPESALLELRGLEGQLTPDDPSRVDLVLAYRDLGSWDDVLRLGDSLPEAAASSPFVVQQLALARNRRNAPGDSERAERDLLALIQRHPDPDSYGLLGRIHKDRYDRTGHRVELDAAIDAYRRGFQLNRSDYYPGVILATLLWVRGDLHARSEVNRLVPELRALLERQTEGGRAGYWEMATKLELAVLAQDWTEAHLLAAELPYVASTPWMLDSTASNVEELARHQPTTVDAERALEISRLLRSAGPGGVSP